MRKVLDTIATLGLTIHNTMIDLGDAAIDVRYIDSVSKRTLRFQLNGKPAPATMTTMKALMDAAAADGAKGSKPAANLLCLTVDA